MAGVSAPVSWNLPPGVSGDEPEFGPDEEWEEKLWCHVCDQETRHTVQVYRGRWAVCSQCEVEREVPMDC